MQEFKPPIYEKSEADSAELVRHLKKSFLTKNLNEEQIQVVAQAMKQVEKKAGENIIRYGDVGKEYYILKEGTVKVTVYQKGTNPKSKDLASKVERTKDLGAGIGFGEIALMYGDKRTATIDATSDCALWELDGMVFKNIILKGVVTKRNIEVGYLDRVELLTKLDKYDKLKLLDGLESMVFTKDELVIKEGDEGDYFYIVEEGEVECFKQEGSEELSVRKLGQGDHFGEIALLNNDKRTLSVRAVSERVKMLALSKEAFTRILGQIEHLLKKDYAIDTIQEDEKE